MIFRQLFDSESCTYTYLLADELSREAALIDTVREQAERDARVLRELDLELKYLLETHVHADHITGVSALKQHFPKAQSVVSRLGGAPCANILSEDGQILQLGQLEIKVLATPGHTNGCVCYLSEGRVFTGDTLLIRGCGRTDFQEGDPGKLYDNITRKLFTLPDETLVYPGHNYIGLTASSIWEEKRHNPRLAGKTREEFIAIMNGLNLPYPKKIKESVPANLKCGNLAAITQAAPVNDTADTAKENKMADIQQKQVDELYSLHQQPDSDRVWLDVRTPDEWDEGIIPGAEKIELATLHEHLDELDKGKTYVVYCRSGGRSNRACQIMADAGFDRLINFSGGMMAWQDAGHPVDY